MGTMKVFLPLLCGVGHAWLPPRPLLRHPVARSSVAEPLSETELLQQGNAAYVRGDLEAAEAAYSRCEATSAAW